MRSFEKAAIAVISSVLIIALSNYLYKTTVLKHLDSVFLFEASSSILKNGKPTSETVASWPDILRTISDPVETLCRSSWGRSVPGAYNVFDNHAYTALYPISILVALTGPETAFAILNSLAHLLLIFIPFLFLRTRGVGLLTSVAFVACISLYPAWSYSATGDYYLDRLYMPAALLSLFFMHGLITNKNAETDSRRLARSLAGFAMSAITAALFTERGAIMMVAEISFFMVFFDQVRKVPRIRNSLLTLLVLLSSYLFFYFKFFFLGIDGGGGLISNLLVTLRDPMGRLGAPGLIPFFAVNLIFLGWLIPFSGWRYTMLAFGAVLPNILISTGGAELNGWWSHYHAMYIPFVIFAASIGYLRLVSNIKAGLGQLGLSLVLGGWIILIAGELNSYTGKVEKDFFASARDGIVGKMFRYYFDRNQSYERVAIDFARQLDEDIPKGVKVSTVEGAMSALYKSRSLSMYPVDIYRADYLVVAGSAHNGEVTSISGAVSYLGAEQTETLNQCLLRKMIEKGFALHKEISPIGVLVFRRAKVSDISSTIIQ